MDSESLPLVRWAELSELLGGTTFTRKFKSGQVLFGKRRSYQKKVSLPDFDGICSGDILVFESLDVNRMLPNFLPLIVQSDAFMDFAVSTSAGSLSPRTKWSDLSRFEFLLPSLREQKDLVEIISSIDKAIDAYQHLSPRSHRESIVQELIVAPSNHKKKLEDFVFLKRGHDLPTQSRIEGEFPVIASNGIVGTHNEQIGPIPGVITGRSGTIGKVVFSAGGYWPLNTSLYVTEFMGNDERFVALTLECMHLERFAGGTSVPSLDRKALRNEIVYAPPIEEQKRVVEIVSAMDLVIQSAEQVISDAKALRKSILGEVFKEHSRA
jgi:type I restriction enzyme S subunit